MYECPQGFRMWLVEKQKLAAPPPDAASDYSLEPADAQLEPMKAPPATARLIDVDEVFGRPVKSLAASAHN